MTNPPPPAVLVLEDGRVFRGEAYGAVGETFGEAVFNTGMTGYQETLTDPSYHRQIVTMTAPHIGNTGVNEEDGESDRIWVAGYVVRDPGRASNWRATRELQDDLVAQNIVGIQGVDTRALTRHLRERGAMRAVISSVRTDADALLDAVLASAEMEGADLVGEVTTSQPYVVAAHEPKRFTVAALDLGIKRNTPRRMAERGIETRVVPATSTVDELLAGQPDGVFLSNGPGDPATANHAVHLTQEVLRRGIPLFGICFGNQILGRALGLSTFKLRYGHRGINQPVKDLATGKIEITAHNHGFAVRLPHGEREHGAVLTPSNEHKHEHGTERLPLASHVSGADDSSRDANEPAAFDSPFGRVEVSHVCLNDDVVEGLRVVDDAGEVRAFSVQYHPEAAAGPHDADYLFDRFVEVMARRAERSGHNA